jgi:hypothetical protein
MRNSVTVFIYSRKTGSNAGIVNLDIFQLCGMVSAFSETLSRVGLYSSRAVAAEACFYWGKSKVFPCASLNSCRFRHLLPSFRTAYFRYAKPATGRSCSTPIPMTHRVFTTRPQFADISQAVRIEPTRGEFSAGHKGQGKNIPLRERPSHSAAPYGFSLRDHP